ncbi:16488_t:CDS:2 [Dentiscutata erythropus]|uniref:16488_t:CDS:1 n=1 Tax=Dentiscutata erythropus TaxID=1348616 RepID=A0A9N9NDL2_9GLOM|nr:16488_t:CDS:2 [Dentiscutata erythropus]
MSNENIRNYYNNSEGDYHKQDFSPLQHQVLHSIDESRDFINKKIIDELCQLHENEAFKGKNFRKFRVGNHVTATSITGDADI